MTEVPFLHLKVGDIVALKSGGPDMTIFHINGDYEDSVQCVWFTDDEQVEDYWFCPVMLCKRNIN